MFCLTLVGCGSDPREGLVAAAVGDLDSAATKVQNIKNKVDDAVKKSSGKAPEFKEAIAEVDALKKIAKDMQELKLRADALAGKTTEEERKDLTDKYKVQLNQAITRLTKARNELKASIVAAETQDKDAVKPLRDKLEEAEGEFEAISRR